MTPSRGTVGRAWKIANELEAEGYSEIDASMILSMALGIFVEGVDGSHRNLKPLTDAMLEGAQMAFDALREARRPGSPQSKGSA